MSDLLQSVAANANQLTVTSLLALLIVGGIVALHKGWVVLGSQYADCIRDRDRFEDKVQAISDANEVKIARMESDIAELRGRPRGGMAR